MVPDHVLVIGFGGPTKPEEVRPFIEEVARGFNIPEARLKEVERHYEAIGGRSPYNELTFKLVSQLEESLKQNRFRVPVFVGMRNWHPFLKETISEIKERGLKKGVGVILAPHRSEVSFERYLKNVEEARRAVGAEEIEYEYLPSWHAHPLFIQAQAEFVGKIYDPLTAEEKGSTHLLFTAHSIPVAMAEKSRYVEEIKESSSLVVRALQVSHWGVAYQSRSGSPREPWLGPDLLTVIRELKQKTVLLVPIGFLCDNAEVLYDLDIEAKEAAGKSGVRYLRAPTVTGHPKFTALLTELIGELLVAGGG